MKFIFYLFLLLIKNSAATPTLIYFYGVNDPVKKSVGDFLTNNTQFYNFQHRFASSHFFPINKTGRDESDARDDLWGEVYEKLKFETKFDKDSKIIFAFSCHGNQKSMCGISSNNWYKFFNKVKEDTCSQLSVITNACQSCDFFYVEGSPFQQGYPDLFEFIVTGTQCEIKACLAAHTIFWYENLKNQNILDHRKELLILNFPILRLLSGISADPHPEEVYRLRHDSNYINVFPTPSFNQWNKTPIEPSLKEAIDGIISQIHLVRDTTDVEIRSLIGKDCIFTT
jgi:hypothetical protein